MRLAHVQWHWAVLQTFGAWGRVIAETPLKEPVIAVDDDRLVLRRVDRRFWAAANCPSCGATIARVDLPAHEQTCARPRSTSVHVIPAAGPGAADPAPRPSAAAGGGRTVLATPHRRRDDDVNRPSARVFGHKPVFTGRLFMAIIVVLAAALAVAAVLASF